MSGKYNSYFRTTVFIYPLQLDNETVVKTVKYIVWCTNKLFELTLMLT